jgi:hypothetical protein
MSTLSMLVLGCASEAEKGAEYEGWNEERRSCIGIPGTVPW